MKGEGKSKRPILALDQAFKTSGYATIDSDGNISSIGIFKTTASLSDQERMEEIYNKIIELTNKYADHRLVIEDIQMQQSVSTYKKLAYAQSAILLAAEHQGIEVELMSASSWRSHLSKKYGITFGRARKTQKETALKLIEEIVEKQKKQGLYLDIGRITQDMADAACIGLVAHDELIS